MVLVVGGQARKVGKTAVVAGIIRGTADAGWTALKVTHHHAAEGWSLERENSATGDSGRYLAAGASESWFLRCSTESLGEAMPGVRKLLEATRHCIIESNSILDYLAPDAYLLVLDPQVEDMKESALRHFRRADAFVLVNEQETQRWDLRGGPTFTVSPPRFECSALAEFVRERMRQAAGSVTRSEMPSGPD